MSRPPTNRHPTIRALLSGALAVTLTFAPSAFALGPLEKNLPSVEAGTQAYNEGRFEDALAAYQAAKKEKPDSAAIDFNIGNALYKLGRYDEAREAWLRAANVDRRDLKAKDFYNLGNGFAALNQDKDAIASYRKALTLDPNDEMARHNLEVLLRKLPPKQHQQSPDGGTDGGQDGGTDGGRPDAGMQQDGGTDGGAPDGGGPDGGSPDGGSPDGGSPDGGGQDGGSGDGGTSDGGSDGGSSQKGDGGTPDGGQQDGGQGEGEGGSDGGTDGGTDAGMSEGELGGMDAGTPQDLSEQDAAKLLDSMKRNEKNLQLWRFQQRKKPRNPDEKDW